MDIRNHLKNKYEKSTKTQKRIISYLIENIYGSSYLKIDEMAAKVNTQPSTITRFCKSIGFMGYTDLQKELRKTVLNKLKGEGQYEKARNYILTHKEHNNIFYHSLDNDLYNLNTMIKGIDKQKIKASISLLNSSRKIYIVSSRSTLSLGHFFYFRLKKIFFNVYFVTNFDGGMFDDIKDLRKDDLVVAISFPTFSSTTISFVKSAKKYGVKILSITNSQLSPLYKISDICLYCPYKGVTFFTSNVSAMALINALICEIFKIRKEETLKRLQIEETILIDNAIFNIE